MNYKIGMDIDGCIANFVEKVLREARGTTYSQHFPLIPEEVKFWDLSHKFSEFMKPYWMQEEFWLDIVPSNFLDFRPEVYITSRPIATEVTKQWLDKYGFPEAPVITVAKPLDKITHAVGLDLFVDDYYVTVDSMITNKINAVLFKQPYQVGHKDEIAHLPITDSLRYNDLIKFIKD